MRLELKDLPPRMRKQALKIIADEDIKRACKLSATKAVVDRKRFDSRGEYEFYIGTVQPGIRSGEIIECKEHPEFSLYDTSKFCEIKLGKIRYTPDFMLTYKDGSVEIIEIKSKFVRRMQRDYPVRRRLFIEKYARPNGWKFKEVITDDDK
ncbi:MAG: DUF1064 domain-containing protein [Lachnospiraceae bacterium]|nr:DUF1064 domain-containing protein [Lachnospiraceae bacterium]